MRIRLKEEQKKQILKSEDIYDAILPVFMRQGKAHRRKEFFWVIGLEVSNYINYIELVAVGSVSAIIINPVEVLSFAVMRKCKRLVLVHNHPSGNLEPSVSDLKITKTLIAGASYLGIDIMDHLIITESGYYSMTDEGTL